MGLPSASGTRTIKGRKLFLYADGGRLTTVAWHLGGDSYWISNTLTSDIPNGHLRASVSALAVSLAVGTVVGLATLGAYHVSP